MLQEITEGNEIWLEDCLLEGDGSAMQYRLKTTSSLSSGWQLSTSLEISWFFATMGMEGLGGHHLCWRKHVSILILLWTWDVLNEKACELPIEFVCFYRTSPKLLSNISQDRACEEAWKPTCPACLSQKDVLHADAAEWCGLGQARREGREFHEAETASDGPTHDKLKGSMDHAWTSAMQVDSSVSSSPWQGDAINGGILAKEGLKDHSTQKGFQRSLVTKIQRQSVQHGEQCLDGKMLSCLCVTLPGNTTLLLQAFNISMLHVSNVNPMNGWVCHLTIATYVKYFQFSENFEFHGVSCLKKIILFWLYHDSSVVLCHPQTESEFKEHKFKITTLCFFAWQLWSAKVPWVSGISKFTWGLDLGNPKKLGAKIDLFFYDLN